MVALIFGSLVLGLVATAAPAVAASSSPASSPAAAKPPTAASGVVTFGVQPASLSKGKLAPDARPYFYYGMSPGSSLTDHVAILNYSAKPLVLTVYATDALNAPDGGFGLLPVEKKAVDAGSWVSLGGPRLQVRVPARSVNKAGQQVVGQLLLPVKLTVPKGANPGDHVGGVVASLDTLSSDKDGNRVKLEQRVASRLFIRVTGPLHPALSVRDLRVAYHAPLASLSGGSATISYTVHNGGNVKLGGRQRVSVSGLLGIKGKSPVVADIPLLLPGNSAEVTVVVRHLSPQLRMTASVDIAALQLPGDTNPPVADAKASSRFWACPWPVLGLVLLLVLAVAGYLYRRRRPNGGRGRGGGHRLANPQGGPDGPASDRAQPAHAGDSATRRGKITASTRSAAVLLGLGLVAMVSLLVPTTAQAAGVPYHDPAASGRIGLCDRNGHPVTGGSIGDRPFVWRAVSSVPAPGGYTGTGRKATLLAYQPRPGVSADQWSGDQLSATSDYTNPGSPMAQSTAQDFTLTDFLGEFKPMVDGLLQLRMYFGIPGRSTWNSRYPVTDIRVSGNSWQVVDPVSVSCTNGSGTSSEFQSLAPAGKTGAAPPSAPASSPGRTAKPSSTAKATGGASVRATASSTRSDPSASAVASQHPTSGGSSVGRLVVMIAVLLAVAGGAAFWWRRRAMS
ncbi:MAG: DUF916 domain-containing protein [Actinomycetota bacterium]|nr:DUF916 domain-containing protein [Actinomycetota bacterium]